jgi:G:T/U-mismatch repair DNA glycosylase
VNEQIPAEEHPLKPFLPENAGLLMLGSFPPQKKRWSMDFYYPNFNNDMWRIMGIVFYSNREHFVNETRKSFNKDAVTDFLIKNRIALYDAASAVRRLNSNASDKFLETVRMTDVGALLDKIPQCVAVAATGQKATEILLRQFDMDEPGIGSFSKFTYNERQMRFYRMPSSSRAYPLKIENKAEAYRKMFCELEDMFPASSSSTI